MQNKGLNFFAISIVGEYLPTFFHFCRKQSKNDAKAYAAGNSEKETFDSIGKRI
jgi:hypothetical protein